MSVNLGAYRTGDKVRVTVTGEIYRQFPADPPLVNLGPDKLRRSVIASRLIESVELVERAKPKVGDELTGAELYEADLPPYTLVQYRSSFDGELTNTHRIRTPDGWDFLVASATYILRYIPDAA